jgi:hypothetical protein
MTALPAATLKSAKPLTAWQGHIAMTDSGFDDLCVRLTEARTVLADNGSAIKLTLRSSAAAIALSPRRATLAGELIEVALRRLR